MVLFHISRASYRKQSTPRNLMHPVHEIGTCQLFFGDMFNRSQGSIPLGTGPWVPFHILMLAVEFRRQQRSSHTVHDPLMNEQAKESEENATCDTE